MFHLTAADYVLWLLPQLCVSVVLWRIMRARVLREYPYFVAYCALQLVRFAALFAIGTGRAIPYFFAYWAFEIVDVVLSIAVIRDIYRRIFRDYAALQVFGSAIFHWAVAVLVLMSAWAAAAAEGKEFRRITAGVLVFEQAGIAVRVGLLLLLLVIALFFRLRWNRRHLGIVIGFSLYFLVSFVALALRRHEGASVAHLYSLLGSISYNCCALVWVLTFLRQPAEVREPFPLTATELEGLNTALGKLLR